VLVSFLIAKIREWHDNTESRRVDPDRAHPPMTIGGCVNGCTARVTEAAAEPVDRARDIQATEEGPPGPRARKAVNRQSDEPRTKLLGEKPPEGALKKLMPASSPTCITAQTLIACLPPIGDRIAAEATRAEGRFQRRRLGNQDIAALESPA
jgi:hypothetical protein